MLLVTLLVRFGAGADDRWALVRAHPKAVIDVAESKHHGVGGFETGTFVKVGGLAKRLEMDSRSLQGPSACQSAG